MTRGSPASAFAVATLGIAAFATMDAVMKGLTLAMGAYNTLLWRALVGIILSGIFYLPRRTAWPDRATMRIHVERGIVCTLMAILFFWGLARVPMAQTVALTFIAPLIALYLAAVLLDETVGPRAVIGSLIAFAGVGLILFGQARADLGREALLGSVAIVVSALCYAYNIILMRRQALVAGPSEVAFFQNVSTGMLLALAAPFVATVPSADHASAIILAAILATGSLFMLSWAYARAEANYLAPVEYTAFIWASLLGWLVFDEKVGLWTITGAATIALGCVYAARRATPLGNVEAAS